MGTYMQNMQRKAWDASSGFSDMRRRVWNASPCPVEYWRRKPGSWPYGTLFMFPNDSGGCSVTFGDATIAVTAIELAVLCAIARDRTSWEG